MLHSRRGKTEVVREQIEKDSPEISVFLNWISRLLTVDLKHSMTDQLDSKIALTEV